jgi:hypothetical protein
MCWDNERKLTTTESVAHKTLLPTQNETPQIEKILSSFELNYCIFFGTFTKNVIATTVSESVHLVV